MKVFCGLFLLCVHCVFAGNSFPQDVGVLAEKIRSGNVEQKRDALLEIRNMESAEGSRAAIPALSDPSEIVRATAAFSVIFLPKDEAVSELVPLLRDKFELVRREAAYALGKVGDVSALDPLIETLQKDKTLEVRNAAVIALGEVGDARAIDALTRVLLQKPANKEEFLRRSAIRSIGQIAKNKQGKEKISSFDSVVAILIQILQDPKKSSDLKREAAFALGEIGNRSAVPVLRANISNPDYYLAQICKDALKKISE